MNSILSKGLSSIALLVILTSCGLFSSDDDNTSDSTVDQSEDPAQNEQPADDANDYEVTQDLSAWIPRLDNIEYSYEGVNDEFATFTSWPQFNEDQYYQFIEDNTGTLMAKVYEYREDAIVQVYSRPETYFRDNFTEIGAFENNPEEIIVLQKPIAVGTNWTNGDSEYEITALDVEITVPAGVYSAIEVTINTENSTILRYYAEDVGLVYESTETENHTVESKLEKMTTDTPEEIPINVYVQDENAEGLNVIESSLTLATNDPARVAINELLTGKVEGAEDAEILPEGTEINYLFLNNEEIVEVDVSKEFVDNMNAGSTGESFILTSLVNTLSDYYSVQEVLLTVDGEPFQGPHVLLEEGETLKFDEEMVNDK